MSRTTFHYEVVGHSVQADGLMRVHAEHRTTTWPDGTTTEAATQSPMTINNLRPEDLQGDLQIGGRLELFQDDEGGAG